MLWDRESPHGLLTGNRSKLASEATNRVPCYSSAGGSNGSKPTDTRPSA